VNLSAQGRRLGAALAAAAACAAGGAEPAFAEPTIAVSYTSTSTAVTLAASEPISSYRLTICSGPLPRVELGGRVQSVTLGPFGSPIVRAEVTAGTRTAVVASGVLCPAAAGVIDLQIANVIAATGPVSVGHRLTYALSVTNKGPVTATGVTVTHRLPSTLSFVSASGSRGACGGTAPVRCWIGFLASGESATVVVTALAVAPGPIVGTAAVSAAGRDASPADNRASASGAVRGVHAPLPWRG
jgi:uncharacterized repeat protein (TIGR01451 family)